MTNHTRRYLALVFTLVLGCSSSAEETADTGDVATDGPVDAEDASADAGDADTGLRTEAVVNGWTVSVDPDSGAWSISEENGKPVLRSSTNKPPVRVGRGEPGVKNDYGAFRIDLVGSDSEIAWNAPSTSNPKLQSDGDGHSLVWHLGASNSEAGSSRSIRLQFQPADGDDLRITMRAENADVDAGEMNLACGDGASYFGLGTQVTGLDLRGRTYPLWTQEQGIGKPEDGGLFPLNQPPEAAYAPMGVWHSTEGYSAVVDRDTYGEIDFCTDGDALRLRSYEQVPSYTFVLRGEPRERVRRVTHYTGRLEERPPEWMFGPWLTAVGGPWRLDEVAEIARNRDLPATAIWTEDWIGWDGSESNRRLTYSWRWNDEAYPMLPSRVETLHDNGFAFLGYFNSFVPESTVMFDEGVDQEYLLQGAEGDLVTFLDPAMRTASMVDLSKPGAVEWLQEYQTAAIEQVGLDGWMADFGEWYPLDAVPADDTSSWVFHNRYPVAWARANRSSIEAKRSEESEGAERVFFTRSGWASSNGSSAAAAPAMWAGDQETDWTRNDGLPSVIPIISHAGLSGVPIMGSDIGGFSSVLADPRDKELFVRWAEMAAFHPLMRAHHGDEECENWSFDRDEETLRHFRRYATIHTLLFPYFASRLEEAIETGIPITRHPWLVAPDHEALWSGEDWMFFVGDDLLVAPILEEGASERSVELPDGEWWPLFGEGPAESGEEEGDVVRLQASAPVTEIPVYVRPGSVLPLLSGPVDSMYGASSEGVTDLRDRAGEYRLGLYPDASGGATLDGVDGLSVEAEGLPTSPSLADTPVELDGEALPACSSAGPDADCADEQDDLVVLRSVEEARLAIGEGELTIESDGAVELTVGFGADVWGQWAEPTTLEDLDSDAPSYCENAPEDTSG